MKIFLTGGTGFIGKNFINLALKNGHHIFAITRKKKQSKIDKLTWLFGEIDDAVKLNEKMFERLSQSGTNVTITEITGAGHWLPITHKESVLKEIYA